MNILIIGGSGFVSGTLCRTALEAGHEVSIVTRGQKPLPAGAKAIVVDRHDKEKFSTAIESARQKWDLVVDCIGYEVADAKQDIAVFRDKARHFVFVSTDFVFDPAHRDFPQNENNTHYLPDGYGGNKRLCELEFEATGNSEMAWTIVRPCHIYGPGSQLGCLPLHGRDPQLIDKLRSKQSLQLVGGGHFLQQPITATDLSRVILSCAGNVRANGEIYLTAGPDIIESRRYYQIIAEALNVNLQIEEVPVAAYLSEHPEAASFLCHRIYDLKKLREHGLHVPATPIIQGLREHTQSLLTQ